MTQGRPVRKTATVISTFFTAAFVLATSLTAWSEELPFSDQIYLGGGVANTDSTTSPALRAGWDRGVSPEWSLGIFGFYLQEPAIGQAALVSSVTRKLLIGAEADHALGGFFQGCTLGGEIALDWKSVATDITGGNSLSTSSRFISFGLKAAWNIEISTKFALSPDFSWILTPADDMNFMASYLLLFKYKM